MGGLAIIYFEKLDRESSRDYALRIIKENIVRLELAPGSTISENELAAQLNLSRTPIREALIELSKANIIKSSPQRKSVVSLINCDMVEEARFMRSLLECAVIEQICQTATAEDLIKLRENVRLQEFYLDNYYPDNLMALDNQFHGMLFSIAKKEHIFELIQTISIHFDRVRSMALVSVKNAKIVQDHKMLVDAVESRDGAGAQHLMEAHLSRYKIDTDMLRQQFPAYFEK